MSCEKGKKEKKKSLDVKCRVRYALLPSVIIHIIFCIGVTICQPGRASREGGRREKEKEPGKKELSTLKPG